MSITEMQKQKRISAQTIEKIRQDTHRSIDAIAKSDVLDLTRQRFDEITKPKEESNRDIRTEILAANFPQLRADMMEEDKEFAKVGLALQTLAAEIGFEYKEIDSPSPEEQKLTDDADARVAAAETAVAEAESARYWIKSNKAKAVARAQEAVKVATENREAVKIRVKQMKHERTVSANIDVTLQNYRVMCNKADQIGTARTQQLRAVLDVVSKFKQKLYVDKLDRTKAVEKADALIKELEAELLQATELRDTLQNGSSERVEQEEKISRLTAQLEEVRGDLNEALSEVHSHEWSISQLEEYERSFLKMVANHRALIARLRSDSLNREITHKGALELIKGAADEEVLASLSTHGIETDQRLAERVVKMGVASDKIINEQMRNHAKSMKELAALQAVSAEANAGSRGERNEILADFFKGYGIDMDAGSFFTYVKEGTEAASRHESGAN